MSNNKKDLYFKREFLNTGTYHSTAAVSGTLKLNEGSDYNLLTADFSISDCSRTISLDIDVYDVESLENSVYKMTQIEETAKGMKEALQKAKPILEAWLKKQEENKKKEAN